MPKKVGDYQVKLNTFNLLQKKEANNKGADSKEKLFFILINYLKNQGQLYYYVQSTHLQHRNSMYVLECLEQGIQQAENQLNSRNLRILKKMKQLVQTYQKVRENSMIDLKDWLYQQMTTLERQIMKIVDLLVNPSLDRGFHKILDRFFRLRQKISDVQELTSVLPMIMEKLAKCLSDGQKNEYTQIAKFARNLIKFFRNPQNEVHIFQAGNFVEFTVSIIVQLQREGRFGKAKMEIEFN